MTPNRLHPSDCLCTPCRRARNVTGRSRALFDFALAVVLLAILLGIAA